MKFIHNLGANLKFKETNNDLQRAKNLVSRAINIYEQSKIHEPITLATYYNTLALINESIGGKENIDNAENLLGRALNIMKKINEDIRYFDKLIPTLYSNLGTILHRKGKLNDAVECFRNSLNMSSKLPITKENTQSIAICKSNLANVLTSVKKPSDLLTAEKLLLESIGSLQDLFGSDQPIVSVSIANLAMVYKSMDGKNNLLKAFSLQKKAIKIDIIHFGYHSPIIATRLCNLAAITISLNEKSIQLSKFILKEAFIIAQNLPETHHTNLQVNKNITMLFEFYQSGKKIKDIPNCTVLNIDIINWLNYEKT